MHGRVYFPLPTWDHNSGCVHTQNLELLEHAFNTPPIAIYENRQLATASYRKRRDLNLATPLNISGPSKRGSDALPIKTQFKTQTCTTRLLPWSRFGARQEKGTPENLDLKCSTTVVGGEKYACK